MKLWQKESDEPLNQTIEKFTIGLDPEFDLLLAPYDVLGSIAHVKMLNQVELIADHETHQLIASLRNILSKISSGKYRIREGIEDIHSQVEFDLIADLGEIGKKVHTARSRNDQIFS